jgi:hypothetical protein
MGHPPARTVFRKVRIAFVPTRAVFRKARIVFVAAAL